VCCEKTFCVQGMFGCECEKLLFFFLFFKKIYVFSKKIVLFAKKLPRLHQCCVLASIGQLRRGHVCGEWVPPRALWSSFSPRSPESERYWPSLVGALCGGLGTLNSVFSFLYWSPTWFTVVF
jgi:hypothetical protein